MDTSAILAALSLGEEKDWEFKAAKGGLPGSVWDTYSAMANTDGGVIVLGVAQKDGRFAVEGVPDAPKMKQDFWNLANNRGKVSTNLLAGPLVAPITPATAEARSGHRGPNSGHKPEGSGHKGEEAPAVDPEHDPALLAVAEPARQSPRLKPDEMRAIVLRLYEDRYLTFRQLAALLGREPGGLQRWTLRPMAQDGQLRLKYPETPNHPRQAYRTNPSGAGGVDDPSGGKAE